MSPIVWIPLIVFAVALVGGLTVVAVQAVAAWRAFRSFRRGVLERLIEMTHRLAQAEKRLAAAGAKVAELERARAHLQRSLSVAAILSDAMGESLGLVHRVRSIVPRK